jgi:leucyl aminopeptidase
MSELLEIQFLPLASEPEGSVVLLAGEDLAFGPAARGLDDRAKGALTRAARAAAFNGKLKTSVEILAPAGIDASRVILIGMGRSPKELERLQLGGLAFAQIGARKGEVGTIIADPADPGEVTAQVLAADLAAGALLRSYNFKKYMTRKREDGAEEEAASQKLSKLVIHCADPQAAAKALAPRMAVAEGVFLARDLVNEPANVLGPVEFADRMSELEAAGLKVKVLDEKRLRTLKMSALLAVGQGSARPSRVVELKWNGAKSKGAEPLCFVGKGVCFDTGGISMKPAGGMEDMKGDMGGAACVAGLMLALARRKAPVNAVGLIGLTENMPSGTAQRPGDIVTSMSGQTIEVLNTDAEGRLVLADVLWYAQEHVKPGPSLIIDLATLTGAIIVALGKEYAGLFSNDDELASRLAAAGDITGEKVWRMPLAKAYDKLIDSKNADMKNIGGRHAGAITGAQFVQRFLRIRNGKDGKLPWAHIDIAGTAMDSSRNEINQSWGSGWGVRLLDRLVADNYEKSDK